VALPARGRLLEGAALLALVVVGALELEAAPARDWPLAGHVVVLLAVAAGVAARRPAVTVLAAAALAAQAVGDFAPSAAAFVLVLLLVFRAAATPPGRSRLLVLLALVAAYVAVLLNDPSTGSLASALPSLVLVGAAALAGTSVAARARAAVAARAAQEEQARAAAAQERTVLARELHDVVTHSLSVIVVQAGAARLDAPPGSAERLAAIEDTARSALVEMRRLLGVLRGEPGAELSPQPGLDQLPELLDRLRAAHVAPELVVTGEPRRLPPGVDLAAYRVVQEAVTNVLTHSRAARVTVSLDWHPDRLALAVVDDGPAAPGGGGGRGLVGLRERTALYDGVLEHGPRPDGGYAVTAVLPLTSPAPTAPPQAVPAP
jgi:signal transduction histidine kinase